MSLSPFRLISACFACLLFVSAASGQTLRIYNIDVEQADSALLVMPNGRTLLIDSGKNGHGQRIKAVMDAAGVTKIDAFVASHYHEDHFGGIDDLVNMGVPVLEAYDRGDKQFVKAADKSKQTYKDYQSAVGEDAKTIRRGDSILLDPTVSITCLGSGGVVVGETNPVAGHEENDMSVALLISFAGFRAYFGGDSESFTEEKIVARHLAKDVDFYKASHHGSHSSSSSAFMAEMKPSLVVISNGSNGSYHHPRKVSMDTYAALAGPPVVLQTNKCFLPLPCGNVANGFIADTEAGETDGIIETTVNAAAGNFTVKWRNDSRTIPIKAAAPVAPFAAPSGVLITALLPNPVGSDDLNEAITLTNSGAQPVSLAGWILRDRSGLTWDLAGNLAAGQTKTFKRNGQTLSLNNAGDEIVLVDPAQAVRDTFTYSASSEGVSIKRP